jgi:hypothetical protein
VDWVWVSQESAMKNLSGRLSTGRALVEDGVHCADLVERAEALAEHLGAWAEVPSLPE